MENQRRNQRMLVWYVIPAMLISILLLIFFISSARAEEIDMDKIAMIESSNNPLAHNQRDNGRGVFQITKICLDEWNNFHARDQHTMDDLWSPALNFKIADWYLNQRIPQMLKHYKLANTVKNRIWCYNAGIGNVVKGRMPMITKNYLKKYFK